MQLWIDLSVEEDRTNWMCSHQAQGQAASPPVLVVVMDTFDLNRKTTLGK